MKGRLIHHYRIESLLGEGGMGTVYRAIDTHLERPVAVKMLHTHLVNQVSFMERFRNEALILARLNHPNIAVVYNFLQDSSDYFMAMEYVEGDSLETLIRKGGALPPAIAAEITRQGLEGLAHAHRKGILHRDIKPANLMITPEGAIKLMDFGIARVTGEQRLTQANRIVGTLEYMAPELVQGESPSPASDIYAMGILLYELLSGKLPFASRTDYALMQAIIREKPIPLRKLNTQIPKELEAIVLKALDKNPAKRFADAKEFQKALLPFSSQAPALDLAKLSASPPTTDILEMQPIRWSVMPETKLAVSSQKAAATKPVADWLTNNWQTALAATLLVVALLFIGLIIFDRTTEPTGLVANQLMPIKPKQKSKQESVSEIQQTVAVSEPRQAHIEPPTEKQIPSEGDTPTPAPTEKKPKATTPRRVVETPVSPKTNVPVDKPSQPRLVETPTEQKTEPERSEPVTNPPKPVTHKSIAIRRLAVNLALIDGLSSAVAREGQSIRFRVTEPVISNGEVVVAAGAFAYGEVSRVKQAENDVFRKKNLLEFRIHSVEAVNGQRLPLRSATISDEAKGQPVVFRSGQTFEVRTGDGVITL
ncbi:protein kinase [Spirosoma sp. SC4-14]|uniref:serine/threonine protein kinase n=1 Tax=Spirosoma sp. SC4-14 TaxID=3128900 RepID=UPI0030D0634B